MSASTSGRRGTLLGSATIILTSFATAAAFAATITVNSTSDTVANDGVCTLREAIAAANSNAASGAAAGECAAGNPFPTVDTIAFAIPGAGVHTIMPASDLPAIIEAVDINGYTQPGATVNTLAVGDNAFLLIEIDGENDTSFSPTGLRIQGPNGGSTLRGLIVNRFPSTIYIGLGSNSDNNKIVGNFIGTDPTGMNALGSSGVQIHVSSNTANTIGGTTPAVRNVIGQASGGGAQVISIDGGGGNFIQGNYIGVNAAGNALLAGGLDGIGLSANNNVIGGTTAGSGNVIAVPRDAFRINASGNVIQGNFIGTNATGTAALGGGTGIFFVGGNGNIVGGATAGAGNLISGHATGIWVQSTTGTIIQGNKIGTDITGTLPIPNASLGIKVENPSGGSVIGGTVAGAGNVIAFNGSSGISLSSFPTITGWSILGNSIFGNGGLGISLNSASPTPTPNDPGDADQGGNNWQNYPVLSGASINNNVIAISGALNSTAGTPFRVEFFSNATCDVSGNGEGQAFLGFANVTTNGGGNVSFGPVSFPVPSGQKNISATATSPANDTSEFSACVVALGPPELQSAKSRRVHGAAGTFDLPLAMTPTNPTTEPRQGPGATIVMTFDAAIIGANVAVTEGSATAGAPTFSGNDVIVPLTGVVDRQYVTVTATNVASATNTGGGGSIRLGFLAGDVNQNRVVTVADLGLVNAQLAQVAAPANFLKDVNTSGSISVADKGLTNANLTRALPLP